MLQRPSVRPSSVRPSVHNFKHLLRNCLDNLTKFYAEPPWEGGTKVYINSPGHMTYIAAMSIYGKNFKNLLLQNHKSYDLESWHVAFGTQALQKVIEKQ